MTESEWVVEQEVLSLEWTMPQWGQLITLIMIALALGMDAFSLGIGLGMNGLLAGPMARLSLSIGFFHVMMPLIGICMGQFLSSIMKEIASMIGGGMLLFLGISMLIHVLKGNEEAKQAKVHTWVGILMFSTSVSMDSLSAGFSLGLFQADIILALILFGSMGLLLALLGWWLGKSVGGWIGQYGEILGGLILILLGGKFLF